MTDVACKAVKDTQIAVIQADEHMSSVRQTIESLDVIGIVWSALTGGKAIVSEVPGFPVIFVDSPSVRAYPQGFVRSFIDTGNNVVVQMSGVGAFAEHPEPVP